MSVAREQFVWREDDAEYVTEDASGRRLVVSSFLAAPTAVERARILDAGLEKLPLLLDAAPRLLRQAHKQIGEDLQRADWPRFDVLASSMNLTEVAVMNGEDGQLRYEGGAGLAGYAVTIFCEGVAFEHAELERTADSALDSSDDAAGDAPVFPRAKPWWKRLLG
jgi:hypothetical protein